jgi:hypothetical protein
MPVIVPMVQIRIMRMPVHKPSVPVEMCVRFANRIGAHMLVLVVLIVVMPVLMLQRLVEMFMLVPLGKM